MEERRCQYHRATIKQKERPIKNDGGQIRTRNSLQRSSGQSYITVWQDSHGDDQLSEHTQ